MLARALALAIWFSPVFLIGANGQEIESRTISAGEVDTYELAGRDPITISLDARGTALVQVENLGRDSILTIYDAAGERLLRAAGWRGPEHYYKAIIDLEAPVTLSIEPDDPISPPGRVRVRVELLSPDSELVSAERRMTEASDLILRYYFGEGNTREEALSLFLDAANRFSDSGDQSRQADALFESSMITDVMCRGAQTHQLLESAGEIWAAQGDESSLAVTENFRGMRHWRTGNHEEAKALLEAASGRRTRPEESYFYAETINNLGLVTRSEGDAENATTYFQSALEIWSGGVDLMPLSDLDQTVSQEIVGAIGEDIASAQTVPWLSHSLRALGNLGWAHEVYGDLEQSESLYLRALELSEDLKTDHVAAVMRNNLGDLYRKSGDMQRALQYLEEAREFFTVTSPDNEWAGRAHFNLAQLYRDIGDQTRAREELQQALQYRTTDCDPIGRAATLRELAAIDVDAGESEQALELIREAQNLLVPYPGNEVAEARLLELSGLAFHASGDHESALRLFDLAFNKFRSAGDRFGQLTVRTARARTNGELERFVTAKMELNTALALADQLDSRLEAFRISTALGGVFLAEGKPREAIAQANLAIDLSESVRRQLVRPILLRDFSSVQRSAYDVLVHANIILSEESNVKAALAASDLGRARRFSDLIRMSEIDLAKLTPDQSDRYTFLMGAIASRAEARTEFLIRNDEESADIALRELLPLVDEIDVLHDLARRPGIPISKNLSIEDIQNGLSENDLILEYYLGSTIAGVWSITKDAVSFSLIPNIADVLADANSVVRSMRQRQTVSARRFRSLSESLLGGTGARDSSKHNVVIVPDGNLHFLPFASLLDPGADFAEPFVANRIVSHLPSVRALAELRNRESGEGSGIAIVADPVFEPSDPRVRQQAADPRVQSVAFLDHELERSMKRNGLTGFPRLPGTLAEARAIEAAAGDMRVFSLYGADANRENVLSDKLSPYRILHFATHGVLDAEEPALSGIVLSGSNLDGERRTSFLRTQDIVGLPLNADLVVLSGCETGLGRPVNGEGVLGLSRAFFYAGAEQVISTLWQVPDQATAELMGHFYRALLQEKMNTADALRFAQLKVRSNPRWQNPYYWAPFVLQGDWVGQSSEDTEALSRSM